MTSLPSPHLALRARRAATVGLAALIAVVGFAGCGDDDDAASGTTVTTAGSVTTVLTDNSGTPGPAATEAAPVTDADLAAVDTLLAEVDGGLADADKDMGTNEGDLQ